MSQRARIVLLVVGLCCTLFGLIACTDDQARAAPSSQADSQAAPGNQPPSSGLNLPAALMNATPQQLLQFGINPLTSAVKFAMPNMYQGAQNDLSNGYYLLTNQAQKGYQGVTNQFSSMSDNLMSRYHSMQANLVDNLQQQVARQEEMLTQMYEILSNPEQICKDLAKRTKETSQQAKQQASQLAQQAQQAQQASPGGSFMNKWMGK